MNPPGPTIGIFAKTYRRATLAETLDAAASHGFRSIQFNLSCAGLPTLPDALGDEVDSIGAAIRDRGLTMAAVSGTFNAIDPDRARREANLRRFAALASACQRLGTRLITLCTGTRDREDLWRHHPENDSASAWDEMTETMRRIVTIADRHNIVAAFEPETGNVVDSAVKARRLLDEIGSTRLKVVIDPANLFGPRNVDRMASVLDEAFSLLASDVALIHAKDLLLGGAGVTAAGLGILDYERIAKLYRRHRLDVPVILHGLPERDVPSSRAFVIGHFAAAILQESE